MFKLSFLVSIYIHTHIYIYIYIYIYIQFKAKSNWNAICKNLRHKTGGSGIDSRQGPWKFSSNLFLLSALSIQVVHSGSNRNECQGTSLGIKCGRRLELKALPSGCAKCQSQDSLCPLCHRKTYIQAITCTVLFLTLQACTTLHSKSR